MAAIGAKPKCSVGRRAPTLGHAPVVCYLDPWASSVQAPRMGLWPIRGAALRLDLLCLVVRNLERHDDSVLAM